MNDFHYDGDHPQSAQLPNALLRMAEAGRQISDELRRAALIGNLGFLDGQSMSKKYPPGVRPRKLDILANDILIKEFRDQQAVTELISKELEEPLHFEQGPVALAGGKLCLAVAPLDGSSNIDINDVLGTIFAFYRGGRIVAAGYLVYGPSTLLVIASGGRQVRGYTLDASIGRFELSHPDIRCPPLGSYFATSFAHHAEWPEASRNYIDRVMIRPLEGAPTYSLRYSGTLAADAHRVLIEGGLCLYPPDNGHPKGGLRLLYEALPLAFIFEEAGGKSFDGVRSILEHPAAGIHDELPAALGSERNVAHYAQCLAHDGERLSIEHRWRAECAFGGDKESA